MNTFVPFLDLHAPHQALRAEILAALEPVLTQGQFILGPAVERFEANFARYVGARHCIGVNNGTSALHLALQALDVGPGDEVITTPHTWISTTWAISYVGARPVYVDIDPLTYNLDPSLVEAAITPRTKALLPVHLYGQAADLAPLQRLAEQYGLVLIEDAAQAHGAIYQGRRVGVLGKVGCFSFYPGKNLGACGEAGGVVTSDPALAERIRCLRDHAQRGRHHHVEIGYNMRMEGMQGAVLEVKLRYLDAWNAARARVAARYRELLADVPGLVLPAAVTPESHVWHLYVVLLASAEREQVRRLMHERGVSTGVHYPTLVPFQPVYARLGYRRGTFPVAERVAQQCLSLPIFPELTDEQVIRVAEVLRDSLGLSDTRRCAA
jgi:dTDP-4-amino-4,6-dideoxygalactose transaminase